jgi:hypothetical protein
LVQYELVICGISSIVDRLLRKAETFNSDRVEATVERPIHMNILSSLDRLGGRISSTDRFAYCPPPPPPRGKVDY